MDELSFCRELGRLFYSIKSEETNKLSNLARAAGLSLTEDYVGVDLSGEDLSFDDLSSANFEGVDFSLADISSSNLTNANLINANLTGADLTNANLVSANLVSANLVSADLTNANLINANLAGANLAGANLINANLVGANLAGANLTEADLTNANLVGVNLTEADLNGADLNGANLLPEPDLTDVNFNDLTDVNFNKLDLINACSVYSSCQDALAAVIPLVGASEDTALEGIMFSRRKGTLSKDDILKALEGDISAVAIQFSIEFTPKALISNSLEKTELPKEVIRKEALLKCLMAAQLGMSPCVRKVSRPIGLNPTHVEHLRAIEGAFLDKKKE